MDTILRDTQPPPARRRVARIHTFQFTNGSPSPRSFPGSRCGSVWSRSFPTIVTAGDPRPTGEAMNNGVRLGRIAGFDCGLQKRLQLIGRLPAVRLAGGGFAAKRTRPGRPCRPSRSDPHDRALHRHRRFHRTTGRRRRPALARGAGRARRSRTQPADPLRRERDQDDRGRLPGVLRRTGSCHSMRPSHHFDHRKARHRTTSRPAHRRMRGGRR